MKVLYIAKDALTGLTGLRKDILALLTNWLAFLRYRDNAAFNTRTLVWCFPRIQCGESS